MQWTTFPLVTISLLTAPLFGQSTELYSIDKPDGIWSGWGQSLVPLADLDGDGTPELLVGIEVHGGGQIATVHSGSTGAHLYTLSAPAVPLFYGTGFAAIRDETGDGVPELVAIGAHSGDSNSPNGKLIVYSGADGALLREVATPADRYVLSHMQSNLPAVRDIDGDGYEEVFCRTALIGGGSGWSLISTLDGHAHYNAMADAPGNILGSLLVRTADRDGDGAPDFAVPVRESNVVHIEYRSGATGTWISDLEPNGLEVLTGNSEPLIEIADLDGDGRRDLAAGNVFDGSVRLYSSDDGDVLEEWDCDTQGIACFGSRLIEVPDINADGHPDLLALESNVFGSGGMRVFALDPASGEQLFEQHIAGLSGGYTHADRMVALADLDSSGYPTFAIFEGVDQRVVVRRILPEVGLRTCPSTPNSSGEAAVLRALGSASLAQADLRLQLEGAPVGQPVFFAFGSQLDSQPFGGGTLCLGGIVGRFPAEHIDQAGRASRNVDFTALQAELGSTWTFQAVFRDPAGGGAQTSDALRIELQP